jgi:hypothetical protein
MVALPQLPQIVADIFPLVDADRDDLLRQIFDHFLNVDGLDPNRSFQLQPHYLRLHQYGMTPEMGRMSSSLQLLAQNVFGYVFEQLFVLGFSQVVAAQRGFHYVFDHVRENGYQVVLKNIAPSILSTQHRYDPALYP